MTITEPLQLLGISYLILVIKMMIVGGATSYHRLRSGLYATPEDSKFRSGPADETAREDIERARRAHRNDLENILPFFGAGLFYALTNPSTTAAFIYFFGFAAARVAHSVFYLRQMQPHRTIAYAVGQTLMTLMTLSALFSLL